MRLPLQLLFTLILVIGGSEGFTKTWYVDSDGPLRGTGKSWADAVDTIHQAVRQAKNGDEIWVKAGTYALSEPIVVNKAVGIYGGFTGIENERRQRNWSRDVTIIDGQEAVYHCLIINADAVVDGFTITGGNANGEAQHSAGGGLFIYDASPDINNCTITKNKAEFGGGLFIDSASPSLSHCTISKNTVTRTGGGFYNRDSSPLLRDCKIVSNSAKWAGGIYNLGSSGALNRCVIAGNSGIDNGGGIYSRESGFSIISSIIWDNKAKWGAGIYNHRSKPNLFNCTLYGNVAEHGGAIRNKESAHSVLKNCILWNNTASDGTQILNDESSEATVIYSDVQGGHEGAGNIDVDPRFIAPGKGVFRLKPISPALDAGTDDVPGFVRTDFEDQPRKIDGDNNNTARIDMGADEYHPGLVYKPDGDISPLGSREGVVSVGDAVVALRRLHAH